MASRLICITHDGSRYRVDLRHIQLLDAVMKTNSIARACRDSDISYKTALSRLRKLKILFGKDLIISTRGGTVGTRLTDAGLQLIREYYMQISSPKTSSPNGERFTKRQLEFQASLLEQVRGAVIATDLSGRILYWNRFAEHLYQWKSEQILDRRLSEVILPDHHAGLATEVLNQVAADGFWEGEFTARRKDGSIFMAQAFVGLVKQNDECSGFVLVSYEISQHERASNESKSSTQIAPIRMIN